jgi:hypothetical protein
MRTNLLSYFDGIRFVAMALHGELELSVWPASTEKIFSFLVHRTALDLIRSRSGVGLADQCGLRRRPKRRVLGCLMPDVRGAATFGNVACYFFVSGCGLSSLITSHGRAVIFSFSRSYLALSALSCSRWDTELSCPRGPQSLQEEVSATAPAANTLKATQMTSLNRDIIRTTTSFNAAKSIKNGHYALSRAGCGRNSLSFPIATIP